LSKSTIQVEVLMRASARVVNRCRWMYSTLTVELKDSAAACPLRTDAAMRVGGVTRLPDIRIQDILREAASWGLPQSIAEPVAADVLDRMFQLVKAGRVDVDTPALDLVVERIGRIVS
jgi:hypothetical protein